MIFVCGGKLSLNDPGVCEGRSETVREQRNVSFVNAMFGEAAFTGFHIPAWIVRTKRRGMGALKKRNHPHGFELSRFVRTVRVLAMPALKNFKLLTAVLRVLPIPC